VLVWALMSGYSPFRAGGLGILTALVAGWLSGLFHDLGVSLKPAPDSAAAVFAALVLRFVALVAVGGLFYGTLVYGSQIAAERFGPWTGIAVGIALVAVPALLFGWRRTLQGLNLAARDTIQLVAVCAVAGIIVGVVALTGIGGRFSEMILGIAGANQLIAMVFVAMVALILGMGMPTTAAYAIGAAVLAPGLGRIGVEALVAHFFIFYFDHPAGRARFFRRRRHGAGRSVEDLLDCAEDGSRHLHRAVHVLFQSGAAVERLDPFHHPGGRHRLDRRVVPRELHRGLVRRAARDAATCSDVRRRPLPAPSRVDHRPDRPGDRRADLPLAAPQKTGTDHVFPLAPPRKSWSVPDLF
jgi:hypothetical protein